MILLRSTPIIALQENNFQNTTFSGRRKTFAVERCAFQLRPKKIHFIIVFLKCCHVYTVRVDSFNPHSFTSFSLILLLHPLLSCSHPTLNLGCSEKKTKTERKK